MLKFITEQMASLQLPYEFMEWTQAVKYPYIVGEYSDVPTYNEDGSEESSFILTVTTRGKWFELEQIKETIKKHFPSVFGLRGNTDSGSIAVYFSDAFPVPTGEADLKRLQINLTIKQWKGVS